MPRRGASCRAWSTFVVAAAEVPVAAVERPPGPLETVGPTTCAAHQSPGSGSLAEPWKRRAPRFGGGRVGAEQVDQPPRGLSEARRRRAGRAHLPRTGCRWGGWWGDDDLAADAADVDARPSAAGLVVQDLPAVVGPGEQVVDAAAAGERLDGVGQVAVDGLERPQAVVAAVVGVDVQRPQSRLGPGGDADAVRRVLLPPAADALRVGGRPFLPVGDVGRVFVPRGSARAPPAGSVGEGVVEGSLVLLVEPCAEGGEFGVAAAVLVAGVVDGVPFAPSGGDPFGVFPQAVAGDLFGGVRPWLRA